MKKILLTILAAGALYSCGGNSDKKLEKVLQEGTLEELKQEKDKLHKEVSSLNADLERINDAIAKKDTVERRALITTFKVHDTLFNHYLELQANVQTNQNLLLNAEYSGILQRVYVKEGQKVSKGQQLAKIDDGGLSQQLAQAEIQRNLAKTTFERQKRLWDQKIGSEIQYLEAKSSYEAQEQAVAQLHSQIEKTVVRAPFNGTIEEIETDEGSAVTAGSPIVRIVNLGNMYIETEVPEQYISSITDGTDAIVYLPVLGNEITTKVRQASNYINPGNRSFKVLIDVPNKEGKVKPNLTAKVKINDYTSEKAILFPLSVISENANGEQYIYLAEKSDKGYLAKKSFVTTGKTQSGKVEILSGVKQGDLVIEEGARSVKEGQKISIKE